jgi:RNA polymerase sigma-70 factor (ECF subfamily)
MLDEPRTKMLDGPTTKPKRTYASDDGADLELLKRINTGDRAAFRELYVKHYHPLLRFMFRITGELESAQEGINDVMLVVWRKGRAFEGKSKVSTWILGIAYRKALKLRANSRRWINRFKAADSDDYDELSPLSGALTDATDLQDLLEHGMRGLPTKQRMVVELTYFYGYSYEEIAVIVDCPVNTVKTRMFHARARLKKLLPQLAGSVLR